MTTATSPPAAAAMLLLFDIQPEAIDEHDEWHSHEHLPERLSIPGFRRGSRWTRTTPGPRYSVVYEVDRLEVLDSPAYRQRLDHPTPWTTKMMSRYVGMRRTLCRIDAASGHGLGGSSLVASFAADPARAAELDRWLVGELVPSLAGRRGLASCRLLRHALPAAMTAEQAIRGRDDAVSSALWVTGYDADRVAALAADELSAGRLGQRGATGVEVAVFGLAHALTAGHDAAASTAAAPAGA